MQQALTTPAPLVCVQVDRFRMGQRQGLIKRFTPLSDFTQCHLPVYTDQHITVQSYQSFLVAGLIHVGSTNGGHYRLCGNWETMVIAGR